MIAGFFVIDLLTPGQLGQLISVERRRDVGIGRGQRDARRRRDRDLGDPRLRRRPRPRAWPRPRASAWSASSCSALAFAAVDRITPGSLGRDPHRRARGPCGRVGDRRVAARRRRDHRRRDLLMAAAGVLGPVAAPAGGAAPGPRRDVRLRDLRLRLRARDHRARDGAVRLVDRADRDGARHVRRRDGPRRAGWPRGSPTATRSPRSRAIEALVALLGGLSALGLFAAYAWLDLYEPAVRAGVRGRSARSSAPSCRCWRPSSPRCGARAPAGRSATLLAADYVGAFVVGLAFPLVILPALGQIQAALAFGAGQRGRRRRDPRRRCARSCPRARRLRARRRAGAAVVVVLGVAALPGAGLRGLRAPGALRRPDRAARALVVPGHRADRARAATTCACSSTATCSSPRSTSTATTRRSCTRRWPGPHERVLVLGGGDGLALREVLRYPGVRRAVEVDLDAEMLRLARDDHELRRLNGGALTTRAWRRSTADAFSWLREARRALRRRRRRPARPRHRGPGQALLGRDVRADRPPRARARRPGRRPVGLAVLRAARPTGRSSARCAPRACARRRTTSTCPRSATGASTSPRAGAAPRWLLDPPRDAALPRRGRAARGGRLPRRPPPRRRRARRRSTARGSSSTSAAGTGWSRPGEPGARRAPCRRSPTQPNPAA